MDSIKVTNSEDAYKLFNTGHNVYCRSSEELESIMIPNLLNSLRYGINNKNCNNDRYSRGEIETFHTAFQENFTIQLSGCKKWTFKDSSLVAPIRGCAPHFNANNMENIVEQQLKVHKCTNKHFHVSEFQKNNNANSNSNNNNNNNNNSNINNTKTNSKKKRKIDIQTSNTSNTSHTSHTTEESDVMSVVLYPGDILYHPAGVWHV